MEDDGRLSPAELDALLGTSNTDPSPPPPGNRDVLDRGPGRPTWGESAWSWVRGHRLASAALALVVGAGTLGGWGYLSSRPPPLVTTIDATALLESVDELSQVRGDAAIPVRTMIQLDPAAPGDALRAIALRGAGLEEPQVSQSGTHIATSNLLNCNALADLTTPTTFALTVERTDQWGRIVTQDIVVSGLGAQDAGDQVLHTCLARAADALQLRAVSYDAAAEVPLRLEIRNPTAVNLFTFGAAAALGPGGAFLHPPRSEPFELPAGTVTTLPLAHDISDCWARPESYAHDWRPSLLDQSRVGDLGVVVVAFPGRLQRLSATALVTLNTSQRQAVVRAVDHPCRDAPRLRYSVTAVAADRTSHTPTVELTVRASVPAGSIDLAVKRADGRWLGPGRLERIGRSAVAAVTSVRLRWRVDSCQFAHQDANERMGPRLRAEVRLDHHSYPYLLPVWQPSVRAAVVTACEGVSARE